MVKLAGEFEALGVDLVALDQAIDTTTPAGRLTFGVLGAVAQFEADLTRERVLAGLARAKGTGSSSPRPPPVQCTTSYQRNTVVEPRPALPGLGLVAADRRRT